MLPIRYFVLNTKTNTAHIYGGCQQTKPRPIPIRLFDSLEDLEIYAERPLKLCDCCNRQLRKKAK